MVCRVRPSVGLRVHRAFAFVKVVIKNRYEDWNHREWESREGFGGVGGKSRPLGFVRLSK